MWTLQANHGDYDDNGGGDDDDDGDDEDDDDEDVPGKRFNTSQSSPLTFNTIPSRAAWGRLAADSGLCLGTFLPLEASDNVGRANGS